MGIGEIISFSILCAPNALTNVIANTMLPIAEWSWIDVWYSEQVR